MSSEIVQDSPAAEHAPKASLHSAIAPIPAEWPGWAPRHQAMNDRVKAGNVNLLWIGDSIVENWERQGKAVWEKYYAHRDAVNLGIGGDRTEHVLWRLEHGNIEGVAPALAIVMIGQNNGGFNTAEEIAEGVTAIVTKLRRRLPDTKILLLAIFYRGEKPNDEQIKLAAANEIVSKLADDRGVFYMNVNDRFLRDDGSIPADLMPDFEHPSELGYEVWAAAIEAKVAQLLGDASVKP